MHLTLLSLSLFLGQLLRTSGVRQQVSNAWAGSNDGSRILMVNDMPTIEDAGSQYGVEHKASNQTLNYRAEYLKFHLGIGGSVPRKFQCYSCMSLSYQNNWERLQHLYVQPKASSNAL